MKEKIVVVGFGWVGQANALSLALEGYKVSFYDIGDPTKHYESTHAETYGKLKRISEPLAADGATTVYLVCVGDRVDEEGNQDIMNIRKALVSLEDAEGTVVLRSTVLPGSLASLPFSFYLPEFLHERAAVQESLNPQFIVIGRRGGEKPLPSFIETWRKRSMKAVLCTPEEASHIKYLSNLWNALRIAFTNEFGSTITEPDSPEAVGRIDATMNFLFENRPYRRYGRSFGGHCLPKDTRAYVKWCEEQGRTVPLMKAVLETNDAHRQKEARYPHLPQWHSNWPEPTGSGWVALQILGKSIRRNLTTPFEALKRRKTIAYRVDADD